MILVIDKHVQERIKEIIEYAHAHPLSLEDLKLTMEGKLDAIGTRNLNHVIHLYDGFKVVYSEEHQPKGLFRHISVSQHPKIPHPVACAMIMKEFGFKTELSMDPKDWIKQGEFVGWLDEEQKALNFLEKVKEETLIHNLEDGEIA